VTVIDWIGLVAFPALLMIALVAIPFAYWTGRRDEAAARLGIAARWWAPTGDEGRRP